MDEEGQDAQDDDDDEEDDGRGKGRRRLRKKRKGRYDENDDEPRRRKAADILDPEKSGKALKIKYQMKKIMNIVVTYADRYQYIFFSRKLLSSINEFMLRNVMLNFNIV